MTQSARSNPLAQKQPVSSMSDVESQLRQGLGALPDGASLERQPHKTSEGKEYTLFVIRAYGREWAFDTEMSTSAAFRTGESVAKMIAAAAPPKGAA